MTDEIKVKLRTIEGAGGSKKQRTPVEAPNSLQSRATVKTVEVISEGEIKGIVGGLKGVFFDDTPVQSSDGTFNFPAVRFEERKGTPSQAYMPGFPGVESAVFVNTEVKFATPVVRSVSSASVDAVRVLIRLPQGLQFVDTKNGDQVGHRVGIAIDTRPTGGVWNQVFSTTITGKTTSPYEEAYRIEKPTGITTGWDVRVRRTSAESTVNNITDRVDWFSTTELQDIKLGYENAAIVGIALDSESTGGQVPRRSYLVDGLIIKVPTNYFPTQYDANGNIISYAYYSGTWNGTFKWSWCDDPAWIVYDLITNTRYGAGNEIDEADIDVYSFYQASQYNCQLIDNGSGQLEPRFRCNISIMSREDSFKMLNAILANCRSYLWGGAGYIALIQDRPQAPRKRINNAQVVDGIFNYTGTELSTRITAVDVTFNDRLDRYQPRTVTEQASSADIAKYGYRKLEINALGVVDETQARRMAKWAYDSTLVATEFVNFQTSWQNATIEMGEVFEVYDNFYIGAEVSGMVVAATTTTGGFNVTLDRAHFNPTTGVPITNGATMTVLKMDGTQVTGTLSSVVVDEDDAVGGIGSTTAKWTVTGITLAELVNSPYVITSGVSARQFKVTKIEHAGEGVYGITAIQHDPTKYARVEQGIVVPPPTFTILDGFSIAAPAGITVTPESYFSSEGILRYRLRFNWDKVSDKYLKGYKLQWRRENNQYQWTDLILQNEFLLEDALFGVYEFSVYAYNNRGVQSAARNGFYNFETLDDVISPSPPPTNFRLVGGGNTFSSETFTVEWLAPEFTFDVVLREYEVRIRDFGGTTYTKFALPLTQTSLTVTREDIVRWCGFALREIRIEVRAKDTLNRLTAAATPILTVPASTNVFTNAAPPVLTGISLVSNVDFYTVVHNTYTGTPDAIGVVIHHSTSPGFAPSSANIQLDSVGTTHIVPATPDTTYYVRLAAYDTWSNTLLNYSSEFMVTTGTDVVGINPITPTNLTASSVIQISPTGVEVARITVGWDRSTNTSQYDLELTNLTTGSSQILTVSQPDSGSVTYTFEGVPGNQYRFRVRSRAATNVSNWTAYVNLTAAADTVGPGAASGVSLTPAFSSMLVQWVNPLDEDLVSMEVWRRVGSSGTGSLVTTVAAPLTFFYDANLPIGNSYSYRVRGIDRSGNAGTYTAWTAAQTVANVPSGTVIGPGQIGAGAVQNGNLANGAVGTVNIANGAITATQIASGTITGNLIAGGTILGSNIVGGTITGNLIAANTINTGNLVANSITSGLIQADAIKAVHLDTGSVTADSVATNQIITNSANVADAVITNAKIVGTIQSNNYVPDVSGWAINKTTGAAEFENVKARGDMITGVAPNFRVEMTATDPTYAIWAGSGVKNDANAVFYLKKNGQGYFGGSLSAGILRTAVTNPSTAANAEVINGPFGSNGGQIDVVVSYAFNLSGSSTQYNFSAGSGSTTATVQVYRKVGAGSETLVNTFNYTGSLDINNESEPDTPSFFNINMNGSNTILDQLNTSDQRTYRAIISSRTIQSVNTSPKPCTSCFTPMNVFTQSLTIITTEQ